MKKILFTLLALILFNSLAKAETFKFAQVTDVHYPKTGSLTWELNLDAHEVKKLTFSYQVKYPIGDKILVE